MCLTDAQTAAPDDVESGSRPSHQVAATVRETDQWLRANQLEAVRFADVLSRFLWIRVGSLGPESSRRRAVAAMQDRRRLLLTGQQGGPRGDTSG